MMARLIQPFHPTLLSFILLLTSILSPTRAESYSASSAIASPSLSPSIASNASSHPSPSSSPTLRIVDGDGDGQMYQYAGCWNETFGLPGTLDVRALRGANQVLEGTMTVGRCLDFCARGGNGQGSVAAFRFAGLEFSRECWCGDELNFASIPLPDEACNTPCDGANDTACGGALRLSIYNSTDDATWADAKENAAAGSRWEGAWRKGGMTTMGTTVLLFGIALAGL